MFSSFLQYVRLHHLFQPEDRLLLAVSGGVDSVVMAHLCVQTGNPVVLAHCNFQLRGEESERDEAFVRRLGEKLGVPVLVQHFETETLAKQSGKGIQETARDLRYAWFRELTDPENPVSVADKILTAHHADDNMESLLMHFFRGTGMNGLSAMEPKLQRLVRPLLYARKEVLLKYAHENGLDFVEDSSNLSDKYTRNYFRHAVLPVLKDVYPEVETNLLNNIERFRDARVFYRESIERLRKKLVQSIGKETGIPVLLLEKQPGLFTLVYELFRPYGFTSGQVPDIVSLLKAQSGKQVISTSHRVVRHRKWLIISAIQEQESGTLVWEEGEKEISFPHGTLRLKTQTSFHTEHLPDDPAIVVMEASAVVFPLIVRRWRAGDYFYPLGLGKKKKLKKFLSDKKLSLVQKEQIYVLESAGRILWVIGHRMDERCRPSSEKKSVVEFRLHSSD